MDDDLSEIATSLKTTSVLKMAAALGMQVPPKLSIKELIAEFLLQATPHQPTHLQIALDNTGATVSWKDPGAGKFFRATKFNWNLWVNSNGQLFSVTGDTSNGETGVTHTKKHLNFTVGQPPQTFELHVQSFNHHEHRDLASPVGITDVSTHPAQGGGNGIEGGVDVGVDVGNGGGE